ncbi:MAG: phosphoglycolate phosphatase [Usitatibacter sp.]
MAESGLAAVLFDLDGTLADTAPDMARTVNLMRDRRGLAPVPDSQVRPHVSSGARGMICSAFGMRTDHPDYATMRAEFLDLYVDNLCIATRLFPGMEALLDAIEASGLKWGVVTNKFERMARLVMAGLGLSERAGVIVGGDTCPRAKPFPDPLLHAAAVLGVEPARTLYIGDDERDVQAARAAGMPVIVAGYGYLGEERAPSLWGADAIMQSVAEIDAWVRNQSAERAA